MDFQCQYEDCPFEGPEPYRISLPEEIQVDPHNIATMFCPHCEKKLVMMPTTPAPAE